MLGVKVGSGLGEEVAVLVTVGLAVGLGTFVAVHVAVAVVVAVAVAVLVGVGVSLGANWLSALQPLTSSSSDKSQTCLARLRTAGEKLNRGYWLEGLLFNQSSCQASCVYSAAVAGASAAL